MSGTSAIEKHTIAVLVDNEPGVLARVIGLFSGRGYNIESLTVAEVDRARGLSRITVVTSGTPMIIEQIKAQLGRLVPVHAVRDLTEQGAHVERELALIKVAAPAERRAELISLAEVFHARVADLGPEALVFEIVGAPEEIDSFEELVRPHGVKELVRTGRIGLTRASDRQGIKRRQHVLR